MYNKNALHGCRIETLPVFQRRRGRNFLTGDSLGEVCEFEVSRECAFQLMEFFMNSIEVDLVFWFSHSRVQHIRVVDCVDRHITREPESGERVDGVCLWIAFGIKPPVCRARQGGGHYDGHTQALTGLTFLC